MDQRQLRKSIEQELQVNLLPFWRERSLDHARGGFIAEMNSDGALREDAPKGLILNARLLWTFAALYRELGDERDRELARRAYDYLEHYFRDPDYGGYVWRVDPEGQPLDVTKKVYGQAFCVYALSEYHRATGDANALRSAAETCNFIERYAHDASFGGYVEVLGADWSPVEDMRLGDKDMSVAKSMNNHIHILEAYTTLHGVWPNPVVAGRLRELIRLFEERMLTPSGHFDLFFDEQWKVRSDSYTYGHDIEAAWLLREAAAALGDKELEAQVGKRAVAVASAVLREGLDPEGGLATRTERQGDRRQPGVVGAGGGHAGLLARLPAHEGGQVRGGGGAFVGVYRKANRGPGPRRVVLAGSSGRVGGRAGAESLRAEGSVSRRAYVPGDEAVPGGVTEDRLPGRRKRLPHCLPNCLT